MNEYDNLLAGANEYDAQLQVDGERDAQKSAVRTTLFGAVQTNPDQYAEAKRVGSATGVPADIAVRNLDSVRQRAQLNEYDKLVETSPKLATKLTDPEFAKLAHDDTPQLGTLERLANSFKRGFTSTLRGGDAQTLTESAEILNMLDRAERGLPPDASTSRYGSLIAGASGSPENIRALRLAQQQRLAENALEFARRTGTLNSLPEDPGQAALRRMGSSYGFIEGTLPQFLFGGDAIGTTANTVAESLSALAPSLPLIVGSGAAGGARALAGATGLSSFGTEYVNDLAGILNELKVDTTDEAAVRATIASPEFIKRNEQALVKAGVIGVVDALTAGVGGARLASSAAGNLAAQTGVQAAGGAAGEALGSVASGQEVDPTAVLLEAIGEIPTATVDAASLAVNRIREKRAQATDAEQNAEITGELLTQAAGNKLRERDPQAFEQFMQSVADDGPVPEFYVDAQALAEAAQSAGVDLAAVLPSVGEQLQAALASGGDVRIPAGEFFTRVPGSGLEQSVLPLVKTDPDGMTQAQAQEFRAGEASVFEQEVGQATAEQVAEAQRREQTATIEAGIYDQLQAVGRFSPSVNRSYATLTAQFYDTLAQRTGIPAAELAQRYPLSIRGPEQGGASVLDQFAYHGTPHLFDEFKTSQIGTGEGAQAFGYGLYFAENKNVADDYRQKLSDYSTSAKRVLDRNNGDVSSALADVQRSIDNYKRMIAEGGGGDMRRAQSFLSITEGQKSALERIRDGLPPDTGNLYTVDIPDDVVARMLDWDKPLSEQPPAVKAILDKVEREKLRTIISERRDRRKRIAESGGETGPIDRAIQVLEEELNGEKLDLGGRGESYYKSLSQRLGSDKAASDYLDSIGIPGIRYLDAGSRADGDGSHNLVVFNDQNVRVVDRNGQPVNRLEQNTNAQTDTPEFRNWFGDSKVVDADGEPLVVYHGTHADITKFKKTKGAHLGFHFGDVEAANTRLVDTSDGRIDKAEIQRLNDFSEQRYKELASFKESLRQKDGQPPVEEIAAALENGEDFLPVLDKYRYTPNEQEKDELTRLENAYRDTLLPINKTGIGSNILPVYLSIKNPLRMPDVGNWGSAKTVREALPWYSDARTISGVLEEITARGYDGIVYANRVENPVMKTDSYIAFRPNQIKSAIGNNGNFDPNNPSILEQNTNAPRATISFTDDITQGATIALLENADLSSYNHELAHFFLEVLNDISNRPDAPPGVVADTDKVLEWFGITGDEQVGGEQGGTLEQPGTAAFDRWFGDSKVVDADGEPLVVYHGSARGGPEDGVFKPDARSENGIFFTDDPYEASDYAMSGRYSRSPKRIVVPVYLSFKNPLVIDFKGKEKTSGFDGLIENAKYQGYDGLIVKNLLDSPDGDNRFGVPTTNYIAFRPEQIKSAIGNRGTFDPNSPNILEQSTPNNQLVALHNLSVDNLLFADKLGGLPVPSIGITKAATPYRGFGEITLIGRRDLATPSLNNPVFAGDAYTQRFPDVVWPKVSMKKAQALIDSLGDTRELRDTDMLWDRMVNTPNRDEAIREAQQSAGMMRAWLREQGETPVDPVVEQRAAPRGAEWANQPAWLDEIRALKAEGINPYDLTDSSPEWSRLSAAARKAADSYVEANTNGNERAVEMFHTLVDKSFDDNGVLTFGAGDRAIGFASSADRPARPDMYATRRALQNQIGDRSEQFGQWAAKKVSEQFGEPSITVKGRKVPLTLENVVEAMASTRVRGREKSMTFGGGQVAAANAKQFRTLEELQAERDRIVSPEAERDAKKTAEKVLDEYRTIVLTSYTGTDYRGQIDTWAGLDASMKALADLAKKAPTLSNLRAALARNGFKDVPTEGLEAGVKALTAVRQTVTDYFEAKPQRAVMLSEFAGALIPDNAPAAVREILERAGVAIREYASDSERDTAVGEFASELNAERNDVLFQNDSNPEPFGPLPPGRTRREVWNAMGIEQRRQYHEQFARGFEAYLFEGKAPSKGMREIFRRFAAWMKRVYRQMSALRVNLTDEVRGVYDRLLATDDAIRAEQRARSMAPLLDAEGQPVGDAAVEGEATDDATERLAKRSLRDMQWLANARSAAMRRLQRQGAEQRKEVRREVETEVRAMPVYAVQRFLKRGEVTAPDGSDVQVTVGNKLAIDQVQTMFGEDRAWRALGFGKYGMLAKENGLPPDVVAEMFGFPTGEVMVRQILAAAPEREMIEGMTDQRVLERYGDVSSPDALSRAANEELSNDAHIRFIATELAGLRNLTGKAKDLAAAARMAATRTIGNGKVKDVRPRQYIAAEGRAARKAEAALAAGDRQQAARHKREQLLTVAMSRESYRAQEEIDKALRGFERVFAGKDADVAKRRNLDLVKAARAVLGRYGLGPPSDKSVQYLAYVEKYDPGLYAVLKPVLDGALQGQDYRELSVDDFRAVRDAVQSLWTQSKRAKEVEIDGAMMDREQVAGELVAQVEQLGGKRYLSENRTSTEADRLGMTLLGMRAALRRVESFVDSLDQGNPTGPWRRFVWQPISDAAARYRLAKLDKLKAYRAALDTIAPTLTYEKIAAPELGGFVFEGGKQEVLHAMLHSGNQSNLNKLVAGYRWGDIDAEGNVDASRWWSFLDRMSSEGKITKADWDFVQTVWDLLESTKADTQAAFRDMYGMYFAEVTAKPVQTPFGTYRGGYVPAKTDPAKVAEAQKNEESVLKDGNDIYAFPSTGNGFTKSRVESYTKELQLDLRQIASHLDWVLRFTYLQPRVLDVYRTINDRAVRGALGEVAPRAVEEMLTPWLSRTALQMAEKPFQGTGGRGVQRALNYLRRTSSMQLMSLNLVNALQNLANLPVLALKVPPARISAALLTMTHSPKRTTQVVAEKSDFMRTRLDSQVMDIQRSIADTVLNPSATEKVRDWAARHGHFLSLATQNLMDVVAWTAAYDAAVGRGQTDLQAVREADAVVRQTQGSLAAEDVSAFEASNAFVRVFTMFYSFFNTQANLLGTEFTKAVREQGLRAGAGRALWVYTFGLLLPAVIGELIAQSLRGQLDLDGDDDDEPVLGSIAFTLEAQAKYATAMVPGVGQLAIATMNAFNSKPYDDRIGSSPAVGALEAAVRVPKDVYEIIAEGKDIGRRDVKDVLTLVGLMTGTPAAVLARPIGYQIDVDRGATSPDGPLDYTRGLVTGSAPR